MNSTSTTIDARDTILATGQRLMAARGFSAVGLNEILAAAGVPKGSFYHYFASKDAFGEAVLERYFQDYLAELDITLAQADMTMAQRLIAYFEQWRQTQSLLDCQGKCLAVKLAAEVADLSEAMRLAIRRGADGIVARLTAALDAGVAEGSIAIDGAGADTAHSLYQLWLGASVMVKIQRQAWPFEGAMRTTRHMLHLKNTR